jgi:hypothetical protein
MRLDESQFISQNKRSIKDSIIVKINKKNKNKQKEGLNREINEKD